MADLLVAHLEKKSKEHSALEMLANQWGFDKNLIPKALQNIGSLFPHYSRHDESHSKQILVNIERILGNNIELLTATDTWLILEAAYWHDIGMVVPRADRQAALESPEFRVFISDIAGSSSHQLSLFAESLKTSIASNFFSSAESPLDSVYKFNELMAEWFRRSHPERANSVVQSPWNTIGVSSPRTELIPLRLFKTLGHICEMHGAPFETLMVPGGLPFREGGLAQEDCHPRFVACLLRMGDLLDLDNNRFCPVMQRISGEDRPCISKAHEEKHAAIRHFRLDKERIEITAECETIDGYLEAFKWFDWLKKEMQDQMSNWQDIVPSRELGLLPTLGDVKLGLCGEYQILDEGQRPQFSIDHDKAISLIQGSNLYESKFACIRELLQNSVDATLIAAWIKEQKKVSPDTWLAPANAKAVLERSPVEIELKESSIKADRPGASKWILRIKDYGTGISREDLSYMMRIGASQKNKKRQSLINSMPEWLKPSGAFGIGLQSSFLICDSIKINTKSLFTNESLELILHSPTGKNEGLVQIRALQNDPTQLHGTTIEIVTELANRASPIFGMRRSEGAITERLLFDYDPLLSQEISLGATKLADQIAEFSERCLIPMRAKLEDLSGRVLDFLPFQDRERNKAEMTFYKIEDQEVEFEYELNQWLYFRPDSSTYYRGQNFESGNLRFSHIKVWINLLSGSAGSWLNASRDKIASSSREDIRNLTLSCIKAKLADDIAGSKVPVEQVPLLSLAVASMKAQYGGSWPEEFNRLDRQWLKLLIDGEPIEELFKKDSLIITQELGEIGFSDGSIVAIPERYDSMLIDLMLNEWCRKPKRSVTVLSHHDVDLSVVLSIDDESLRVRLERHVFFKLDSASHDDISVNAIAAEIIGRLPYGSRNNRLAIPVSSKKWEGLFLRENVEIKASYIFRGVTRMQDYVLLPFLFVVDRDEFKAQLSDHQLYLVASAVKPYLRDKEKSVAEVVALYKLFVEYIDEFFSKSKYQADWQAARNGSEL